MLVFFDCLLTLREYEPLDSKVLSEWAIVPLRAFRDYGNGRVLLGISAWHPVGVISPELPRERDIRYIVVELILVTDASIELIEHRL